MTSNLPAYLTKSPLDWTREDLEALDTDVRLRVMQTELDGTTATRYLNTWKATGKRPPLNSRESREAEEAIRRLQAPDPRAEALARLLDDFRRENPGHPLLEFLDVAQDLLEGPTS